MLYKCGYLAGLYSSIETFISNNVTAYCDAIRSSSQGWKDRKNSPNPFVKYMLDIIVLCYEDFDCRQNFADYINQASYEAIKSFAEKHNCTFSKKEALTSFSNIGGRSVAEANLKKLIREGIIKRIGLYASALYINNSSNTDI